MYPKYSNDRFDRLCVQIDNRAEEILEEKKAVYSPNDDRLEDFHFVAQALGIRPSQVAAVYLLKHVQSLAVRIRDRNYQWYDAGSTEGLLSRAADIINLTKLLMACVDEEIAMMEDKETFIDATTGKETERPTLNVSA